MFSAVIACRNDAVRLGSCLRALAESTHTVHECIVVDDGSSDESSQIAARFGAIVIRCDAPGGPAKARNMGARAAGGDVLLFLDADVRIHADAVARMAAHLVADPRLDAVIGSYDDQPSDPSFVSQYRNLLHCYTHQNGRRKASTFWCGCGAIRRDSFWQAGGLPEHYRRPSIEDIEFGHRLIAADGAILLDPQIQVQHLKRWTLTGMLRTDIFDRAIPWTRLILRSQSMPDDLSVRREQRASVALALATLPIAALGRPVLALVPALTVIGLNHRFYAFLIARRGVWFALRAVPLHFLYFLYSGLAFAAGAAGHALSSLRAIPKGAPGKAVE